MLYQEYKCLYNHKDWSKSFILETFVRKSNRDIKAKQNQTDYTLFLKNIGMVKMLMDMGNTLEEML